VVDNLWVVDVEGDGLYPTKLHCMSATNDSGTFSTTDYDEMREFLDSVDIIVGHNFRRWDKVQLERLLNIEIKAKIVDTLALSWTLEPGRHRHGLADWGEEFGVPKPKIEDWHGLSSEEYVHRCEQDTIINWKLWQKFLITLNRLYNQDKEAIWRYLDYIEFKMDCAALQEKNRWKIDLKLARDTLEVMEKDQLIRSEKLAEVMPQVPIVKQKTYPAKPLKKDGTLSEHGRKWQEFLQEKGLPRTHKDPVDYISGYNPPNPGSVDQLKAWLFSLGWKPQTFKYVKEDKSDFRSKQRAIPQLNKPAQEGGGPCDSIKALMEDHPEVRELDGFLVLRHRLSVINGFLENVDEEGYIKAEIQGLTNTLRFQHAIVVNLPRIDRVYGPEIRGSLIAREGNVLVGADMSSLEDRIKQHFINKFDPEFVKQVNVPGYDPHLALAVMGNMMTQVEADGYKSDEKRLKPIRSIAKNGNYACQYGAGPPKLALTAGISLNQAKQVHEAYWKINWGVKAVAEDQQVKEFDGQMWLLNPINGFYYSLRNEKDIFSTLVQGTASYCFDVWLGFVLQEEEGLIGQFHDEFILEVEDTGENRQRVEHVILEAIVQTNDYIKLDRELGTDVQFGTNYGEIH